MEEQAKRTRAPLRFIVQKEVTLQDAEGAALLVWVDVDKEYLERGAAEEAAGKLAQPGDQFRVVRFSSEVSVVEETRKKTKILR